MFLMNPLYRRFFSSTPASQRPHTSATMKCTAQIICQYSAFHCSSPTWFQPFPVPFDQVRQSQNKTMKTCILPTIEYWSSHACFACYTLSSKTKSEEQKSLRVLKCQNQRMLARYFWSTTGGGTFLLLESKANLHIFSP